MENKFNYYFSAKNNAFYPLSLKAEYLAADSWPDDAVALDDKTYMDLLEGQSEGKCIMVNEDGKPVLSAPPPPTSEALIRAAVVKKERLMQDAQDTISVLERAVRLEMASSEEASLLKEWERYSILLYRIDTDASPDISWPQPPE